ncbi:MAG: hypothetical protein AB1716_19400, partial [Planctomycetota bacterium]
MSSARRLLLPVIVPPLARWARLVMVPPLARWALLAMLACAAGARGQANQRAPHIGYIYPAGARQGSVVRAT